MLGNTDLTSDDAVRVSAKTAAGTTDVTMINGTATMVAKLPSGAFTETVAFTVTATDPALLSPEFGTNATGDPVVVDPVAAYQFTFTIPTLNEHATLVFTIDVAAMSDADRTDLLAAVSSGSATLAVQGVKAGDPYEAVAICGEGQTPGTDGCVIVESFNSGGILVSGGDPATATIRFSGIAGHFSTWALVTVRLHGIGAFVDCFGGPSVSPGPTAPTTAAQCLYSLDVDGNDRVDLNDFAAFQIAFAGE